MAFSKYHDMFEPVIDTVKLTESMFPLGDHSTLLKSWHLDNSFFLNETFKPKKKQVGKILDLVTDAYAMFLKEALNPVWKKMSIEERKAIVTELKSRPQVEQRSDLWYLQFSKVITASEFSTLFSSGKKRSDFVLSKTKPPEERSNRVACPTEELNPFGWGIRFEPVVKQILEYKDHCKVYELGRITHKTNPMLAASPDGIIEESYTPEQVGRLIEIKCPYSRKIGGEVPFDYWVQMQIQMEVTNVDECEYMEAEILSTKPKQEEVDLSGCHIHGVVYLIKQDVKEDEPFQYKYVYGDICVKKSYTAPEGWILLESIPWGLKRWHRKVVQRDRSWYESTKIYQDAFWADVETAKKTPVLTKCLIVDD